MNTTKLWAVVAGVAIASTWAGMASAAQPAEGAAGSSNSDTNNATPSTTAPLPALPADASPSPTTTTPTTTTTTTPAPAPTPAPTTTKNDSANDSSTITITKPDHRVLLGARAGALFGGEITPTKYLRGFTDASWLIIVDGDLIVHPFFTVGSFVSFSNSSYHQELNGTNVGEGDLSLITLGVAAKARIPITSDLTARAGIYAGRNFISAHVKDTSVSGGGLDLGLTTELTYRVAKNVAITAQVGFLSQVSGSVSPDGGKDADLAFTPKAFTTVGPSILF